MPVGAVLDGRDRVVESEGMAMEASARSHNVPLITAAAGDVLGLGSLRLEIVSPAAGSHAAPGADPNQRALVILARSPGLRLLLTADAESDVRAPLALSAIDVL